MRHVPSLREIDAGEKSHFDAHARPSAVCSARASSRILLTHQEGARPTCSLVLKLSFACSAEGRSRQQPAKHRQQERCTEARTHWGASGASHSYKYLRSVQSSLGPAIESDQQLLELISLDDRSKVNEKDGSIEDVEKL